ncbi:MAG: DNA-protecting protein DprA [Acidobacteria bacterium]|nr:DNA-protecting protein DprA [Acidobacteriota bacterium]
MNIRTTWTSRDRVLAWSLSERLSNRQIRSLIDAGLAEDAVEVASDATLFEVAGIKPALARFVRSATRLAPLMRAVALASPRTTALVDSDYPAMLRRSSDPPVRLFVDGDRTLLSRPAVAVVGSRRATPYGGNVAARIARELASAGVVVVSGLARGIDTAAHAAALDAGGATIAVLGTGIDIAYPRSNRGLQERVAERGLILSELVDGTAPRPQNFPVRNRIIAGLSLGVVVIEAGERSGSLITARLAAEEGREVFAVPGSIFSPATTGTHRLIQDGAKLLHDLDDLWEELPALRPPGASQTAPAPPSEPALAALWSRVPSDEAIHPDFLTDEATPLPRVLELLLALEVAGLVRRLGGGRYVRRE